MGSVPFTVDQFFGVFAAYNGAVWPAQLVLIAAAVAALALALTRAPGRDRWVSGVLALLWAWTGIAYHLVHFTEINPAARVFGALFVLQSALFLWWGVVRGRLEYGRRGGARAAAAGVILLYALVVYPLLGALAGHAYMASPTFGAPCPAVIYTFGILLLAEVVPLWLLVVPVLWALLGSTAVLAFGVYQDLGLILSAVLAVALVVHDRRHHAGKEPVPQSVHRG
jgi:hypothetical protein